MEKLIKNYIGTVIEVKDNEVSVYVTNYDVDRDKEVILPNAWIKRINNYKKHSILLSSHTYDNLRSQIGYAKNVIIDERGIKPNFEYYTNKGNPEADWGYFLTTQNQAAYSVGFISHGYTEDKGEILKLLEPYNLDKEDIAQVRRVFTDVELLEVSQVVVPANPSAIQGNSYCNFIKSIISHKPEPETEGDYIIIRVKDPDYFDPDSFRTIDISEEEGIKATTGCKKGEYSGGKCQIGVEVQRYLFDKEKWTLSEAEAWVEENKSKVVNFTSDYSKYLEYGSQVYSSKTGRIISEANREKIKDTLVLLKKVQEALEELLTISEPITDALAPEAEKLKATLKKIVDKYNY